MFRRLHHMAKKTKLGFFLPVLLLCFVLVFTPHIAFAGVGAVVEEFLFKFVTGFFGWLAGMAGTMLDWSIKNVVIGFGEIYNTKGMGVAIDNLWQTLRDFFNLTFIFGLVMIGLRMIFDSSNSNTRKMLISLILAALFVNFSLLITKLVVDFSNVAAVQLVNSFDGGEISVAFNNIIGVTGLYKIENLTYMEGSTGLVYIMGIMMILLVLTFVYMAGAILLMIRFAALNLYMLLSPLMFIGMVFPGAMGVTRQYWSGFLSKAFFAPAYILMLYFSYKIMQGFKFQGAENMSSIFVQSSKVNIEALLPPFIITAIFLIASVVIAQKMGMQGANGVISTGKMLTGKAKNIAFAPGRYVARTAVGGTAALAEKANNKLQTTRGGRFAKGLITVASLGALNERGRQEVIAKAKNAKFGGKYSYADDKKFNETHQARENQLIAEQQRQQAMNQHQNNIDDPTKSSAELKDALDDLGKVIRDMSKEEKENLGIKKLTDKNYAVHLTDTDIDNLEKSGKFSAQQIKEIKDARSNGFKSIATHGTTHTKLNASGKLVYASRNAGTTSVVGGKDVHTSAAGMDQRGDVSRRGSREVGKMPMEVFQEPEMYKHITPAMLEERIKNGMTDTERIAIRGHLAAHLGIPVTDLPSAHAGGAVAVNNPWLKWEKGNSAFAAQFFA